MDTKLIKGLSQIQSKYDAFFIDLWGVIHNGIQIYPGAIDVLENLNKLKKRYVLISNAPRPSKSVEKYLIKLKMDKIYLNNLVTSGEAALKTLKDNAVTYLRKDKLQQYSPKFLRILENLENPDNKGLHLIYTQFRKCEGIEILTLILEQNGFSRFI